MLRSCYYCNLLYGTTIVYPDGAIALLREEEDHSFPKGRGGVNDSDNLISSCQICNKIKRMRAFSSHHEARAYVQSVLAKRPIKRILEPGVNPEEMKVETQSKAARVPVLRETKSHEVRREVLFYPMQSTSVPRAQGKVCARCGGGIGFSYSSMQGVKIRCLHSS